MQAGSGTSAMIVAFDRFIRLLATTPDKVNANTCITLLETDHGGHCVFLAEPNGYDGRWAELQVLTFFRAHGLI